MRIMTHFSLKMLYGVYGILNGTMTRTMLMLILMLMIMMGGHTNGGAYAVAVAFAVDIVVMCGKLSTKPRQY